MLAAVVIPAGALQSESGLHTLAVSGGAGGAIVQYAPNQDGQFFVPGKSIALRLCSIIDYKDE